MGAKGFRNVGFFGHAGSGKTTVCDAMVFLAGANTRFGKVADGTSLFDADPEEQKRGCSLSLACATFPYKDYTLNLIDTPGYADFIGEAYSGLAAVDAAVMVVDAVAGVEVGTERLFHEVEKRNLPAIFFVNKMKKENADFGKCVKAIAEVTKRKTVVLTFPIGAGDSFDGVVDVLANKAFRFSDGKPSAADVPAAAKEMLDKFHEQLVEAAADLDDALMNRYLEGQSVSNEECITAIKKGMVQGKVVLVLCGEALEMAGVEALAGAIADYLPGPEAFPEIKVGNTTVKRDAEAAFIGYVFKTTVEPHVGELIYLRVLSGKLRVGDTVTNTTRSTEEKINQLNIMKGKEKKETSEVVAGMIAALVKLKDTHTGDTLAMKVSGSLPPIEFPHPSIAMAVIPRAKGDEEKISSGLNKLRNEDPTFNFAFDPETKQLLISGVGELHLDVILARLQRKYGVSVDLAKPRIKYRETFTKKAEAQGKYKKQTGGHGQYGDCWLRMEPLSRGQGFEFKDEIFGGAIPSRYVPSVEKGVREALDKGILAGFPVTDVAVTVFDGSYHPVDSSDIAFQVAASLAFKAAAERGGVVLLEPIMEVEVYIPDEFLGDVIGDINSRRGKIMGMDAIGKNQMIKATVPEAEMYKYSTSLRSMTQGRGFFTMKLHHYEEVPKEITARIVEDAKKESRESK